MTITEAMELIEATEYVYEGGNPVMRGFAVFLRYGDNMDVSAEHEELFVGPKQDFAEYVAKMSVGDIVELAAAGWRIDDEMECWHHFT